jgi:septum formation protein
VPPTPVPINAARKLTGLRAGRLHFDTRLRYRRAMRSRLVLASASPRRRELLRSRNVDFDVMPSDIPETVEAGEASAAFVQRMALEKAVAVARGLAARAWVLGADTVVVIDDEILGKPRDPEEARVMLQRLAGRVHQVLTGVALIHPDGSAAAQFHVVTNVEMRTSSASERDAYVASGEPMDKAGAYAIQGGAARFVVRVDGSYSNVVGLPLDEVYALLTRHALVPLPAEPSVD